MKTLLILILFTLHAFGELFNINPTQLQEKIDQDVMVIDIRTPPEWKELGVVPASEKLMFFYPNGKYDIEAWLSEFSKLVKSKEQPFVLVCRSGNRTETVGNFLVKKLGFTQVYHLEHGIKSWIKEKRKVTK
jgi:rhodanese-related sulfurtransferase